MAGQAKSLLRCLRRPPTMSIAAGRAPVTHEVPSSLPSPFNPHCFASTPFGRFRGRPSVGELPLGVGSPISRRFFSSPSRSCGNSTPLRVFLEMRRSVGVRPYSIKVPRSAAMEAGAVKRLVFEKPAAAVTSTFARYRGAIAMQVEAFWKNYSLVLVGAVGISLCLLLWRVMFGIAHTFVGLSEGMAKYGFLALAMAMVSFLGIYLRARFTLNPDKLYRITMRKLNTSAAVLEVMGAPLTGTDLRAYVMSGGGPRLKNFKLRLGGKRCFLIYPVRGSERRGRVSVEAKKKKGQYDIKLLAVDIAMASGPDQRLFLIGDEQEYSIGGGLISELRDPIVKAMAAEKEFDDLDEKEEEEDAETELLEAERRHREELGKLAKDSSKLPEHH